MLLRTTLGSQVEAALALQSTDYKHWTKQAEQQGIVLPYTRSDSFVAAFVGTPANPPTRAGQTRSSHVYPAHITKADNVQHIPERIPLDEDFSWLVGAYLSEGCIATGASKKGGKQRPYAVLVSNMSDVFKERFTRFCDKYNIGFHLDSSTRLLPSGKRAPTVSLRMHSLQMGELFTRMFGTGATVKRIDPVLLGAPDIFLSGLLDGYWSRDGSVSTDSNYMMAYSASNSMLQDIQQIGRHRPPGQVLF